MTETGKIITFGWFGLACASIAAKWAAELGSSQVAQVLWAIAAVLIPPPVLLALYVRGLHQRKEKGLADSHWL